MSFATVFSISRDNLYVLMDCSRVILNCFVCHLGLQHKKRWKEARSIKKAAMYEVNPNG